MTYMIATIAFLSGWIVGGSISDWLNRKLIEAQREYIKALLANQEQPQ